MEKYELYKLCYERAIEDATIDFFIKNPEKKFAYKSEFLTFKEISKSKLKEKLPKDFDEKFLDLALKDAFDNPLNDEIIIDEEDKVKEETLKKAINETNLLSFLNDKYLSTQNSFLNRLEDTLHILIKKEKLDEKDFSKYIEDHFYYSFSKITELKSRNLKTEVEETKMSQDTEEEKALYKALNQMFAKKKMPVLPKIEVPLKTEEEIREDIKEDLEDLEDLSRLEKLIADRFYAYVLIKYGKTKTDLLDDINAKINHSNLYREEYNKEIDKDMLTSDNPLYQKDYIYDERGMIKEKLPIIPNFKKLPRDYYISSIYSEDFFNTHERERALVEQIEAIKEEEKKKALEAEKLKNKLHTYKLILKHRLGFSNEQVSDMDDKTVLLIVEKARENGVFDRLSNKEEDGHKIRRS